MARLQGALASLLVVAGGDPAASSRLASTGRTLRARSTEAGFRLMGRFERYLTVWVALSMAAGLALGWFFPTGFAALAQWQYAQVSPVVAVLIWVMIYPMMVQIDWAAVRDVGKRPAGLCLTLVLNWLIKPFSMAALGVLFFEHLFAAWVDPESARQYIAGLILLGVAPCTAMVFVWSQLVKGDPAYTLVQVGVNDLIMVLAFAPIAGLLLGATEVTVAWDTLLLVTVLYVVLPLLAGLQTRRFLRTRPVMSVPVLLARLKPWSMFALLLTVLLLFAFQAQTLMTQPTAIGLIAVVLLVQSYGIFLIGWWGARVLRLPHEIAAPACLIGTSNFFELAVAVAISLFGLNSGAALATVVGVLVEVPVMLSLVALLNRFGAAKARAPHS
jgi:ACR3 family arsenite transporter